MGEYIVALTGATGSVFGVRLIEELLAGGHHVSGLITDAGRIVIQSEMGIEFEDHFDADRFTAYPIDNIAASIASGSHGADAMAVVPCSMSTLSGIACGRSANLLERAADVCIKEGRPLLLSPRETPLSSIHLENMLRLSRTGAIICPPMPGFYQAPETLEDMVNFIIGKILTRLGLKHSLFESWQG